jgi:hypothetical protein
MFKHISRCWIVIYTVLFICALGFYSTANAACTDTDADGYGSPGDASCPNGSQTDCNDNDPAVRPGVAEICDGKDTNCDGWKPATDVNNDNDNYPQCAGDCNDNNNTVYPGAAELCDGLDNNCDYSIPMNERDLDADGYRTCGVPADCNDNDRFINPGAQEWCSDTKDNNCNSQVDETPCICPDADSDGFTASYCGGTDCDDVNNTIYPGAPELCTDGKDNDCNGLKDCADPNAVNCPAITDADGDGYDVAGICGTPDCDDSDPRVYPGATEICDGKDSNCDGWKAPSDKDNDGDGVPQCASDCDDNNPNRFPGNIEHSLRNTCNDFIDNDCDNLTDAGDPNCIGSCQTGSNPKNGPHFVTLLNTDNTVHAENSALSCGKCHAANFQDPIRYACQRCHTDPADTSDPMNGTLKAQYPLNSPYGFGSAPNVSSHTTWTLGDQGCVTCHNPHTQEQNDLFGTTYGKYIKEYICYDSKGIQQFVEFTSNIGPGSFADGAPYNANICNTCHTTTNHQQNDGTAPGGQDHNNSQDCMTCHSHGGGFAPVGGTPAAPHNTAEFSNNCDYCHVSATDYTTPVPDSKCAQCHTPSGLLKAGFPGAPDVLTHQAKACVGCHQLMTTSGNLKLVKTNLSGIGGGANVVFTALTGAGSFADGPPYGENVCNTCHTITNHHQNDGTAPGGQDHNNGADCTGCHAHSQAFTATLPDPVAPHNTAAFLNDCSLCHISSSDFTSPIPDTKCQQCHSPAGVLKGTFPTAPDALPHQSRACVGCHEPMFGTTNLAHVRTDLTAVGGGPNINFTTYTGTGSFADGPPYAENVCNTCHTLTNHQQNDGTAPGGQDHNNGMDCGICHSHDSGFQPSANVPPPHNGFDCTVCHVTPDTYVPDANIPNSACNSCHGDANSANGTDVSTHNGSHYGSLSLNCVECHNPMSTQTNFRGLINLKFIRSTIRGNSVAFEAYSGQYSFASDNNMPADMLTQNFICNTCHTQTSHHQNDGTAPGGQSHNDGTDCTLCHDHTDGLQVSGSCLGCHSTQQGSRVAVAGQFSANSHHIQGTTITDAKCYQCHWEANSDGSINSAYHGGWNAPGSAVDLVVYGNGARPSTYAAGATAVAYSGATEPPPPPTSLVTAVNTWRRLTTGGSGSNRTATFTAGAGTNRMVLIGLAWESSSSCNPTSITGNYGGQTITTINKAIASTNRQGQWMGYVGETGIAGRTNDTITLTFSGCTPNLTPTISAATYQGASQSAAPLSAISSGTSGSSFSWSGLPVVAKGYVMYNVSADGIASFTPPTGYTERYDASASNFRMTGGDKSITANGAESGAVTGNTSSARWALVAVSISPASGSNAPREVAKINQHCLGCHSVQNNAAQPFGDGKTPTQYAWDGLSIDERYSQTGTTTWGKYTTEANAAQKNLTKAYSAHGNAANNKQGWSASTGIDGTIPDITGSTNVACFDCHNSHGSTADGKTTSYTSATTNGGILKDTTAGLGGYTATYKPADFAGSATMVTHKAGAALCFNCHMTASAGASLPWGYSTFGTTGMIVSYWEKPGWEGAAGVNPSGAQQRYPYKNNLDSIGSHFGVSMPMNTQAAYTIGGLCTPCHDPHGASPSLGANQQYAVPMLKGTWLTSPYKEDASPLAKNEPRGGGHDHNTQNIGSTMGYNIDQNTFRTGSSAPFSVFNRYNVGASGAGDRIMETDQQFAGLCMQCHSKESIDPDTNNAWGTYDRIHDSVLGWASASGNNANNTMHGYSCSKCHTPHSSCLPRLAITNCLDVNHRGRVATGGGTFPSHTFSGENGGGQGRGPVGGGGWGEEPDQWSNNSGGNYLWGTAGTSSRPRPAYPTCHDTPTAAGAWPNEWWNNVTEW